MDPWLLVKLLGPLAGLDLREVSLIVERTPTIAVPSLGAPRKRVADLVLIVFAADRRVLGVLIFEVQLSWDANKRWTWGLLAVAFAADRHCASRVIVFTPDSDLRDRMRRRLLPSIVPVPLLIEPDQIPLICDQPPRCHRPRAVSGSGFNAPQGASPPDAGARQ